MMKYESCAVVEIRDGRSVCILSSIDSDKYIVNDIDNDPDCNYQFTIKEKDIVRQVT